VFGLLAEKLKKLWVVIQFKLGSFNWQNQELDVFVVQYLFVQ